LFESLKDPPLLADPPSSRMPQPHSASGGRNYSPHDYRVFWWKLTRIILPALILYAMTFTKVTRRIAGVSVTILGLRWSYRAWQRLRSGESDLTDLKL
jgi:hypothetical protein